MNKYQDNPRRKQLISSYYYPEKVYDDSTSDKAKIRWRHRNFFGESASNSSHGMHDGPVMDSQNDHHSNKNDLESNQVYVSINQRTYVENAQQRT